MAESYLGRRCLFDSKEISEPIERKARLLLDCLDLVAQRAEQQRQQSRSMLPSLRQPCEKRRKRVHGLLAHCRSAIDSNECELW